MKNLLSIIAVTLILTACGTTAPPPVAQQVQPAPQSYAAVTALQQNAVMNAPEWMSKLPKSANAIYENGTATSSDFGMADMSNESRNSFRIASGRQLEVILKG